MKRSRTLVAMAGIALMTAVVGAAGLTPAYADDQQSGGRNLNDPANQRNANDPADQRNANDPANQHNTTGSGNTSGSGNADDKNNKR